MLRVLAIILICLFASQSQAGVTFKSGKISSGTSGELKTLLKDLVTQKDKQVRYQMRSYVLP